MVEYLPRPRPLDRRRGESMTGWAQEPASRSRDSGKGRNMLPRLVSRAETSNTLQLRFIRLLRSGHRRFGRTCNVSKGLTTTKVE